MRLGWRIRKFTARFTRGLDYLPSRVVQTIRGAAPTLKRALRALYALPAHLMRRPRQR